jgi:xanthine dehydrogenase accessory factor
MIWNKILEWLEQDQKIVFLYVINSKDSSPGRIGFKMIINERHEMNGSIGGGIMEHKLIELCKNDLLKTDFKPLIKRQIHKDDIAEYKSGMICSGEQTIAFYQLDKADYSLIKSIVQAEKGVLTANEEGLQFEINKTLGEKFKLEISNERSWKLKEDIALSPELHIVGGGHVGLALSKLASDLDFSVTLYDDRAGLNTIDANKYAKTILITDYANIGNLLKNGPNKFVVLMSFGYRTDKIILEQVLAKEFKYLGMMGSKAKVERLIKELLDEGVNKELLDHVHAPIGLSITSKTPSEIAVSILAQLIQVKNS